MDYSEFINAVWDVAPNATFGEDNDGQLIVYTNLTIITSEDNPSVPLGECVIQEMEQV